MRKAGIGGGKLQSIQVLRAIAALAVLSVHALFRWSIEAHTPLPPAAHMGAFGVDLFFVISGFIVCRAARRAPSATSFLLARYIRVAPVYYVQTAPWLLALLVKGGAFLTPLATSLLFWPVWGKTPAYPLLLIGWTLCFEALFYASLGVVVKFGRRAVAALLAGYAAALALDAVGVGGLPQFLGSPLLLEFLLGAVIAMRPVRERPRLGGAAILAACILFLFWAIHGVGETPEGLLAYDRVVAFPRVLVAAPPAFLLVWGALQLERLCEGWPAKAFAYIGDASYSIYLTHPIALFAVEGAWLVLRLPLLALPFVDLAVGLGAGVLAYRTIEQPLLAFLRPKPQLIIVAAG
jgi:peptidoglycan/LPS O-acetylase OafA/YrhL